MAGMTAVNLERAQLAAIGTLRWRLFVNSLRSKRGQLELGSRVVALSLYSLGGIGAAAGLGFSAHSFIKENVPGLLAVLLWPVFVSWQVLPVMISSFSDNIELSGLLRFPLSYRAYVLVRLLYGLMDVGTILGVFCLTGILIGIAVARPSLLLPSFFILLIFAVLNVLLARMVFAWIERWLAQRRTRELMGGLFILLLLGTQLITPIVRGYTGKTEARTRQIFVRLAPIQRILPPGMAAAAIEKSAMRKSPAAIGYSGSLLLYAAAFGALLAMRLRAQYNGENLSEAGVQDVGRPKSRDQEMSGTPDQRRVIDVAHAGTRGSGQPSQSWSAAGPVAAVMVKEIRYILRSGPLLLTLIMPIFMLLVLGWQWQGSDMYRFPAGVAYALLVLANLLYNCFGTDGPGVQLYLTAPVRMRTVVIAKNLVSAGILLSQTGLIFVAIALIYRTPSSEIVTVTVAWLLFSLPINLAVGNLLSLRSPKRMNFERFGRQQSSTLNVLTSMGIQIVTIGTGALAFFLVRHERSLWPAAAIFVMLAAATVSSYFIVLKRIDRVALSHREVLLSELAKS